MKSIYKSCNNNFKYFFFDSSSSRRGGQRSQPNTSDNNIFPVIGNLYTFLSTKRRKEKEKEITQPLILAQLHSASISFITGVEERSSGSLSHAEAEIFQERVSSSFHRSCPYRSEGSARSTRDVGRETAINCSRAIAGYAVIIGPLFPPRDRGIEASLRGSMRLPWLP